MPNPDGRPGRSGLGSSQQLPWLSVDGPSSVRSDHLRRAMCIRRIGGPIFFASPAFEQALSRGEYDARIRQFTARSQLAEVIYESLTVESVWEATDLLSAWGV